MLQRRKRYKHRTILGYKTLAAGAINMAEVRGLRAGPHQRPSLSWTDAWLGGFLPRVGLSVPSWE